MDRQAHWDRIYTGKSPEGLAWYQPHLDVSLRIVRSLDLPRTARILDVGGGASTFVRDLVDRGFEDVALLDVSPVALDMARAVLGQRSRAVRLIVGDVTTLDLPEDSVDLWHDRAVFHFLTEPAERSAYVGRASRALAPEGCLIVSGFAPSGPARCSGLDVVRRTAEEVAVEFGDRFVLVNSINETHETPGGVVQDFLWTVLRKLPATRPA
jgi:SAM-dependent methyltransferase